MSIRKMAEKLSAKHRLPLEQYEEREVLNRVWWETLRATFSEHTGK